MQQSPDEILRRNIIEAIRGARLFRDSDFSCFLDKFEMGNITIEDIQLYLENQIELENLTKADKAEDE